MSLRVKTLLIIGAVLIGLVVILYLLSQTILLGNYAQLEATTLRRNVERAQNNLTDQISTLAANTSDYAWWDDTYAFAEDHNDAYLENFVPPIFVNLGFNLLVIADENKQVIATRAVDLDTAKEIPIPAGINDFLGADSPLLNHPDLKASTSGIIMLPEGPMLVASQAILTSQLTGPSHGSVIFGQFLNDALIKKLSDALQLPIRIYSLTTANIPADAKNAQAHISADAPIFTSPLDNNTVAGYVLVNDLFDKPALLMEITMPRDIYSQGQSSVSFFLLVLLVVGLVFAVLMILLLEQTVTSRLRALSRDMETISQSGGLSERLEVSGSDELARLGQDVNKMLSALEISQDALHGNDMRLRTVMKVAPILLWSTDKNGVITLLEGKNLDLLGLVPEQSVGKPITEVFRSIPHLVQDVRKTLDGVESEATVPISNLTFDTHYVPLRDENGMVEGMLGIATNITERTHAERALQAATLSLTQKNQQLEYTRNLFRSAVRHLSEGAQQNMDYKEILEYLAFLQRQIDQQQS
jgi:PAS domain S-box-containing protein